MPRCGRSSRRASEVVDPEHLQRHAQLTAQACKSLATGTVSPDDAWLAGLVHDIGYWILAPYFSPRTTREVDLEAAGRVYNSRHPISGGQVMARGVNKVILIGTLGADPETRS